MEKSNLVDVRSLCALLHQYCRHASPEERLFLGLEINRMMKSYELPELTEQKTVVLPNLDDEKTRDAINKDRKIRV